MKVKLIATFPPDVGGHYECCVCGSDAVLGEVEPVLCEEVEGTPPDQRPQYTHESDRLRDEHTRAHSTGIIVEFGHVCLDCAEVEAA